MAETPKMLLVPVDGSEGASAAARFAAGLATGLNVPVRLLFAFPSNPVDLLGVPEVSAEGTQDLPEIRQFSPETFERLRDAASRRAFDSARRAMGEVGVDVQQELLSGDAGQAIVDHADQVPGAMIVMGRRGLSRFKEMMMGSVSQRVLHLARCPVTVVQ